MLVDKVQNFRYVGIDKVQNFRRVCLSVCPFVCLYVNEDEQIQFLVVEEGNEREIV